VSNLGHSGATIEYVTPDRVVKRGPAVREQGIYVRILGEEVCPALLQLLPDGYEMPRLNERVPRDAVESLRWLDGARYLLAEKVWTRPPLYTLHGRKEWLPALLEWATKYPWLDLMHLGSLYSADVPLIAQAGIGVMTHGDPTLANVLWTVDRHEMRICDPLVPVTRVPPLREVDLGMLLKSAAGWEHVLAPEWPEMPLGAVDALLSKENPANARKAAAWGAINCARILPYARDPRVTTWAQTWSYKFLNISKAL
jgi:hypothetical protein